MVSKSKSWCITWNNYPDTAKQFIRDLEGVSMCVFGVEEAETGTPHLQIYMTWKMNYSHSSMCKIFPKCHFRIARAEDMAANYCLKDLKYEKIDNRRQGHRSDFDDIRVLAAEGRFGEIARRYPGDVVRYHAGIRALSGFVDQIQRRPNPKVYWFHGSTGTGKSYVAEQLCQQHTVWWSGEQFPKFFAGYHEHEAVVLDEMRSTILSLRLALRLFDRYPMTVPTFGAFSNFVPLIIIVTSPFAIAQFFDIDEDLSQIRRRIFEEHNFDWIPEDTSEVGKLRLELQCLQNAADPLK